MQIANEMAMLCLVEHPFVVSIQAVSQDSMYTYLVMDLAPGGRSLPRVEHSISRIRATGDFFQYLVGRHALSEAEAQFYIANVLLGLQHIHSQDFVYRDLKPEVPHD